MFKRLGVVAAVALLVGVAAVPAHADTRVSIQIGAPVARYPVYAARAPYPVYPAYAPSPYPGYVWQPAHYVRTPYGPQMVAGGWVPAPYAAPAYIAPGYGPVYGPPRGVAPRFGIGVGISKHGHRR